MEKKLTYRKGNKEIKNKNSKKNKYNSFFACFLFLDLRTPGY